MKRRLEYFGNIPCKGAAIRGRGGLASLVRMRMVAHSTSGCFEIGAEADNLYICSADVRLLEQVKQLLDEAVSDPQLLTAAIMNAGEPLE